MKQERLATPQKTLYGVHRPARFYNRDPYRNIPFGDTVPPMQAWEVVAWSIIAGLLFGFAAFGGCSGFLGSRMYGIRNEQWDVCRS